MFVLPPDKSIFSLFVEAIRNGLDLLTVRGARLLKC